VLNYHFRKHFVLVTGVSETGKTTHWLKLLRGGGWKFLFVFDPDREVAMKCGYPVASTLAEMAAHAARHRVVCFDPAEMFPGDLAEGFAFFCRWVLTAAKRVRGPIHFGCDEIWKVCEPGKGGIPQSFLELMNQGRRFEIRGFFIAQSVNEVHFDCRKQLDLIYTFRHNDNLCLKWLGERGFDPQAVATLPEKGVYLCRDLRLGTTAKGGKFDGTIATAKGNRPAAH
jgi:hypothetical protein